MKRKFYFALFTIILSGFLPFTAEAQCLQVIDENSNVTSSPYWVSCSGAPYTVNFIATTSFGAYTIDWGDGNQDSGLVYVALDTIQHTYPVTTDTFVMIIYTTAPSCQMTGVVVVETPVIAGADLPLGQSTTICSGEGIEFINTSISVSTTTYFKWDFGDGTTQTFNYTNAGQTISHTYNAANVNCQTSAMLIAWNFCNVNSPDTAIISPIQVFKKDVVSASVDANVKCGPGAPFTFTNTSAQNCLSLGNTTQRYERWNFHNYWGLGYDSLSAWQPWPPANPTTITFPTTGSFTATLLDSSFCGIDSTTKLVLVLTAPTAGVTAASTTACVGTTITFNNTSATGYTYKWNFGDNSTYTAMPYGPVNYSYSSPGTYTVSLAAIVASGNSSCRDTEQVVVTILPLPVSAFTASSLTGCENLSVTFTDNSSVPVTTWNWKKNGTSFSTSQSPLPENFSTGTYTVSLTVTNPGGCSATSQQTITVKAPPQAAFTNGTICENVSVQFSDASTSADPVVGWSWDFGDGSPLNTSQNPSHTYSASGVFTVTLIVSTASCSDTIATAVTVNAKPVAAFTPNNSSGCSPLTVSFTDTSSGANTYSWDFGNGNNSVLTNPSSVFTNTTSANLSFTSSLIAVSSAGCSDTVSSVITVFPLPQSSFTVNTSSGCAPLSINFTNTSVGAATSSWGFGDGSALSAVSSPSHSYSNTTAVPLVLTVQLISVSTNACSDTSSLGIQVLPQGIFSFTTSVDSGCAPLSANFNASAGGSMYSWDFGDGNTAGSSSASHVFNSLSINDTSYFVQLIATNASGCADTIVDTVTVFSLPLASFTSSPDSGCSALNVSFTNTTSGIISSSWNFGDGTPSSPVTNPSHSYFNSSTTSSLSYPVQLTVADIHGCTDSVVNTIVVFPVVIASFTPDTPQCGTGVMSFTNSSTGAATYSWDFGDGNSSTLTSPTHLYTNSGTTTVTFNASLISFNSDGCSDTMTIPVNIYPVPQASFTVSPTSQTFPSVIVNATNTSSNVPGYTYSWNFGDGFTSNLYQPAGHAYATFGTYTISLIVSSGICSDTAAQTITILPPVPVASFTGTFTGCLPLAVNFTNTSQYASTYSWNFGDGSTSASVNGSHVYTTAGVYNVSLIATGAGGTNTVTVNGSVTVLQKPDANFTASPVPVSIPDGQVTFTNASTNANSYVWNFGDGDTSHSVNPVHVYAAAGEYQVILYAYSTNGCADTFNYPSQIKAEMLTDIEVPNAFSPSPYGPSSDGTYDPAATNNDIFHPVVVGVKKFDMKIYNRWGEVVFFTEDATKGWDGYYKGKLCQQDVYIWRIVVETSDGRTIKKAGDVLLIR